MLCGSGRFTGGGSLAVRCSTAGAAAGATGFIRLHLIELHPGKDPDTVQGLRDLNVRNRGDINLIGLVNERALPERITHTPAGVPLPPPPNPGQCCQDQYPRGPADFGALLREERDDSNICCTCKGFI